MKMFAHTSLATVAMTALALSQIANPIADFKTGLVIPLGDKILKWECDVNGDGRKEVLFALKSDFGKAVEGHEPPAWNFYIADASGTSYTKSIGTKNRPNSISIDDLPLIDPECCFVGQIDEIGKPGIVTMRIDNPRNGDAIGKIYAFTIEGDHLRRTELARYVFVQVPHALFSKYLADDKRTQVRLEELKP